MKAMALDPNYARNYRGFATGGLAGQVLVLTKKSWGGYHKKDDTVLVIGWGTSVKIAAIRTDLSQGFNGLQRTITTASSEKYVDVVGSFQTGSSNAGGQWAAGDEPLYYIVSPKDIVVAKPRDAEDHIAWLLQHGCHEKALAAVEAVQGRTELLDEVGSRYLDHLIIERKYAEAAQRCPKLLRGSPSAWERWVFHFAHLRQLPVLVPYIPTENPQLSDTAYEVALVALTTNPSFHELLLTTIKNWPPTLYSASPVISAIEPQLNSSSMTDSLKEALAELYVINGQYEKALSLYAELLKPEVFEFIEKYNLHDAICDKVVNLMIVDNKRTVHLLIQHRDIIPPYEVVEQLLHTSKNCDKRYLLHLYLHALFEIDVHAGKDFHDMQVELYAEYEPRMLLPFLRTSQHYRLDKAYGIFAQKELAVEFVTEQHDDELWEELIRQCLQKPEMVGNLLEHTVGNLDPLYIVSLVPDGLEIPRLRDRLVKIVTDYRTETSLRNGCNDILKADCVNLLVKYYHEARRGVYMASMDEEDISVIVFYCCHAYHLSCLEGGLDSMRSNSNQDSDSGTDDEDGSPSGQSRIRCVLCTTAAA
ncbi:unnamed protein product [Miscanthus lutarioriparius]|uniref:Vacuolar protein sorting-associated protein 41 homolog n=1 Tax=Miscanthus lutarioriparius TaxID=422564 RepID=A0A811QV25_9POAL|nr:unnamed protein product [Miscanthus lutarioriparius]